MNSNLHTSRCLMRMENIADELMMANVHYTTHNILYGNRILVIFYTWSVRGLYAKQGQLSVRDWLPRSVHAQCMCSALIDKRVIGLWRQRRHGHHHHQLRSVAFWVDVCGVAFIQHTQPYFPFCCVFRLLITSIGPQWCTHYWLNCRRSAWRLHYTDWPCILRATGNVIYLNWIPCHWLYCIPFHGLLANLNKKKEQTVKLMSWLRCPSTCILTVEDKTINMQLYVVNYESTYVISWFFERFTNYKITERSNVYLLFLFHQLNWCSD